jgi:hypothetical protein
MYIKRHFIIIIYLFSSLLIYAQEDSSSYEVKSYNMECEVKYYKIDSIEYAIFPKLPKQSEFYKYTKSVPIAKVLQVDSLAFEFVKKQKYIPSQGDGCPIIKEEWGNYCRQVICYLDKKGKRKYDEIIQIQYIHITEIKELEKLHKQYGMFEVNWKKNWICVWDGCSFYFNIFYDVRKGKVVDFIVN